MLREFFERLAVKNHRKRIKENFRELEREVGNYGCFVNVGYLERRKEYSLKRIEEPSLKLVVADEYAGLAHISFQLGNLFDSMKYFIEAGKCFGIYVDDDLRRVWYNKYQNKNYEHKVRAIRQELERRNSRLV